MDLTFREGYWIKVCMKLIAAIFLDNYYLQFYRPSCAAYYFFDPEDGGNMFLRNVG
jgi:hypothetical protein